ncbi:MAG: phage baseplate assembly protein V [Myxococcales bacterium]|nr:phage baseplate assembly protein V [Myxococcales bacterium]
MSGAVLATPEVAVSVEGVPLPDPAAAALISATVRAELGLPAQCELVFADPPAALWSQLVLRPGADLRLSLGPTRRLLFAGAVVAVEHEVAPGAERRLYVRAYDALHRLRQRHRLQTYADVTATDLARRLVGDDGLRVEADHDGPVWRSLIHDGRDDLTFLRAVAARAGLYPVVWDGALTLSSLAGRDNPVPLVVGEGLLAARAELNGDRAAAEVEAFGWDPRQARTFHGSAGTSRVGRHTEAELRAADVGARGPRVLVVSPAESDGHAEQRAQAELDRAAAGSLTLSGQAEGDPALWPGRRIAVQGVAPHLDGIHVLSRVEHQLSPLTGYTTDFEAGAPLVPEPQPSLRAAEGEVTQVADPDRLGRVRVKLFGYQDAETEWLRCLSAGGGAGKGFVTVPSIGDRVLLLLVDADPARALVLGGLFGPEGPPDSGVEGDRVERFSLRTAAGHALSLDERTGEVRLANGEGTYVLLSPERVVLHSERELVLESPGRDMKIRAKRIDFEEA